MRKRTNGTRRRRTAETSQVDLAGPEAVRLFQALRDPTRLSLLFALLESPEPRTVSEIASSCTVDLSVVSRHLRQLADCGTLGRTRAGKAVYYQVDARVLVATLRRIADAIEHCHGRKS